MKRAFSIGILILAAASGLGIGCGHDSGVSSVQSPVGLSAVQMDVVHAAFLANATENLAAINPGGKAGGYYTTSTWNQKVDAAYAAANQMLASYSLEPIERNLVALIMHDGREVALALASGSQALSDSIAMAILGEESDALPNGLSSIAFYDRYAELRVSMVGADAYAQATSELGEPAVGTDLSVFMNTMVGSDTFWGDVYPDCALPGEGKSWVKFWRFVAIVAVDTGSGALSGTGYGALGGPGGAVAGAAVGGLVGGLASWGAGDILE